MLMTDKFDPSLEKPRSDRTDPIDTKSSVLKVLPILAFARRLILEPRHIESRIESLADISTLDPNALNPDPIAANPLILSAEPI
jgi:hypothetical protein